MLKQAPKEFGNLPGGMQEEDYNVLDRLVKDGLVELGAKVTQSRAGKYVQPQWRKTKNLPTE